MSAYSPASNTEVPRQQKPVGISLGLMSGGVGFTMSVSVGLILSILFSYGAAKLSYDTFRSVGWAVFAFIFSGFYYPYYALFVSKSTALSTPPPMGMLGARRR
jgi:hypothetical protein